MIPRAGRDAVSAVTCAASSLASGTRGMVAFVGARGECSWTQQPLADDTDVRAWLHERASVDAVVLDAREARDVHITHLDIACRIRRTNGHLDLGTIELTGALVDDPIRQEALDERTPTEAILENLLGILSRPS